MAGKILIIDTYYPDFIEGFSLDPSLKYEGNRDRLLERAFGTSDFYSRNLRALGWECQDVIVNCSELQYQWGLQYHPERSHINVTTGILRQQIEDFKPDVLFFQDLSVFNASVLQELGLFYVLAGQCSCPMPSIENVAEFDVLFTSFPHYVPHFEALGVKGVFNKLAFEHTIWDRVKNEPKEYDVTFVGGVGWPSHWKKGMELLEKIAKNVPSFKWWGYGVQTLPEGHPLRSCYQGKAWGIDMYRILTKSLIVLNRHGEVAQGYTNNMRCYEATGCGAVLLTENSPNLGDLFNVNNEVLGYTCPDSALSMVRYGLENPEVYLEIARNGQRRTLQEHTYAERMKTVSKVLEDLL